MRRKKKKKAEGCGLSRLSENVIASPEGAKPAALPEASPRGEPLCRQSRFLRLLRCFAPSPRNTGRAMTIIGQPVRGAGRTTLPLSYGFTFIEIIIVIGMLSVISLAVYSNFSSGIRIWQRVNTHNPEEDLNIFFDRFRLDLKNSFKFTGHKFLGTQEMLEFTTLVESPALNKKTVGRALYLYKADTGIVERRLKDFSQIYGEEEGAARQLARDIKALKFQYYAYDKENKRYLWLDKWSDAALPLAVRVELELKDETDANKFNETVSIPVSGYPA